MILSCPTCQGGMEVAPLPPGKAVRCPSCGDIFVPELPRADVVDLPAADASDVDILDGGADVPAPPVPPPPAVPPAPASPAGPATPVHPAPPSPPGGVYCPTDVAKESYWGAAVSKRQSNIDALGQLAARHDDPDAGRWRGDPSMPEGWFVEATTGDVGPFASRMIAGAAHQGKLPADAVLKNHHKHVRLYAGDVPMLFPPGTEPAPPSADGWYIEMPGRDMGPFTHQQIVQAASLGQIAPEIMLTYPTKSLRVRAGDVPGLFKPNAPVVQSAPPE